MRWLACVASLHTYDICIKDIYITLRADKKSERRNAINRTDDARCK